MAKGKAPQAPKRGSPHPWLQRVVIAVVVCVGIVFLVFSVLVYTEVRYRDRAFPGIVAGTLSFAGKTMEEAQQKLDERTASIESSGVSAFYQGKLTAIDATTASENNVDSALALFTYDTRKIATEAFMFGRRPGNGLRNAYDRLIALIVHKQIAVDPGVNREAVISAMQQKFSSFETPPKNAHLKMTVEGIAHATEAADGMVFVYEQYADSISIDLAKLKSPRIDLALVPRSPEITQKDAEGFIAQAQAVYARAPFTITWQDKAWQAEKIDVASGVDVGMRDKKRSLVFSTEGLAPLIKRIRADVEIEALDSRFTISNGKVVEFQKSQNGRTIDVDALLASFQQLIADQLISTIALQVKDLKADISENEGSNLGITELVAEASTNFKGSPQNRRKNIANGARLLHGTLIKPGETFSTITKLKPIDTTNGYLAELVIKGNRTIPEVGGGLCQIGTTMFRVTLNAGLPILERRNHSYRVSYYEPPAGMDATIYDPKPDFRFTNDYAYHLLLLTRVDGDNLIFQFWGTKDGRKIEMTKPKIYNVTSPGPTKYIETEDLKPGEKKCIEHAHKGGSTDFDYSVTYPNGEKKTQNFASKYKAWQEVCLVGKAKE